MTNINIFCNENESNVFIILLASLIAQKIQNNKVVLSVMYNLSSIIIILNCNVQFVFNHNYIKLLSKSCADIFQASVFVGVY